MPADWSFYERGFSLFPLWPNAKTPALPEWATYQTQRAAPELVSAWARGNYNTGVATGAVSNCIVLDCDGLLARLEADERGVPPTLTVKTPRGWHFYFRHPGWPVSNHAGRGWTRAAPDAPAVDGWDLRGDGGYVVGPGSYYIPTDAELAAGKLEGAYAVELDVPMADAPDWLLQLIMPRAPRAPAAPKVAEETTPYGRAALHGEIATLTSTTSGGVNDQINMSAFLIGQLVAGGEITGDEAMGALVEALAVLGIPDEEKALGTINRGFEAGLREPRSSLPSVPVDPSVALGTRGPVVPAAPFAVATSVPRASLIRGQTIWHDRMDALFYDCWFIQRQDAVFMRGMGVLSPTSFDTVLGGFQFPTDIEGKSKTRSAWDAFRLSPSWKCPIVYDTCFRPDCEPSAVLQVEGRPFINTYEPIQTQRRKGDPARWLDFLGRILPDERDRQILQSYMCALVQNPGRKFQWWPVVQGTKGNGKTLLLTVLQHAVGKRYTHLVNPEAMGKTGNQFNAWVEGNLLVGVEEIFISDQRHILETFKPLVTNVRTPVEGKGRDQRTGDNYANGVMLTNHRDGVPIDDDERRYAILWTAQQEAADLERDGMSGSYFPDLYDWLHGRGAYADLGADYGLSVINEWLHVTPPIAQYDPAGLCQRAPETSSTAAAIDESLGLLEQEVQEAIECGLVGFRAGVVSSLAMRSLFDRLRKTVAPKRFKGIMRAIGYAQHPLLSVNRGRFSTALTDGQNPVVYYKKGSSYFSLASVAELKAATESALFSGTAPGENIVNLTTARPPVPRTR